MTAKRASDKHLHALAQGLMRGDHLKPEVALIGLHPKQRALILDPARKKAAHPGRRAGKTHGVVAYCVHEGLRHPRSMIPYVAITKDHARRLAWPVLREMDKRLRLGIEFNDTLLRAKLVNGSTIWLTGADKPKEVEKLRGDKYPLVIIDEMGAMGSFVRYLVEDVLKYALIDLDGTVALTGTPPPGCHGYFKDVCTGKVRSWSVHHWTIFDNPKFPLWAGRKDWQRYAREVWYPQFCEEEGYESEDNPSLLRELYGRFVHDAEGLVYRYLDGRNDHSGALPSGQYYHVIGMDIGSDSPSALVCWAFEPRAHGALYQVDEDGGSGLTIAQLADKLAAMHRRWEPIDTVADFGALGGMIVEEMSQRHGLPISPAEKAHKQDMIELMNSDLHEGRIHVWPDGQLAEEWRHHQWEYEPDERKIRDKKRIEGATPNHYADAGLYAWRRCLHWTHQKVEPAPEYGSLEYFNQLESRMLAESQQELEQPEEEWWE
jgi:hypothetical protein